MTYQIQFKCNRWCNAGNYSRHVKTSYTDKEEARADFEAYKERTLHDDSEIRLVMAEGRKYTEIK